MIDPERRSRPGPGAVGFLWGLAEGSFFFIVPDVYIGFVTMRSPKAGAVAWLTSILGSLAAIVCIFCCLRLFEWPYLEFLQGIPGISEALLDRVGTSMQEHGLPYTPLLVLSGIPLKVFGALAFVQEMSLVSVLLWTVFARIVRIGPVYLAFACVHRCFGRQIESRRQQWFLVVAVIWVLFYIFYFYRMSQS